MARMSIRRLSRRCLLASAAAGLVIQARKACRSDESATAVAPASTSGPKPDPYRDAVLVDGEPPLPGEGSLTFVVLPDTQNYSESFPDLFTAQTEWIVARRQARRIAGVFHLGDITNRNTPAEWDNARRSMKVLDDARMPFCMVPGNHDYGAGGQAADRTTLLNDHFPLATQAKRAGWGGVYDREPDRVDNNFQFVEAEGRKFLVLGLEFGPRKDVVRWANEIAGDHPHHEIILVTHAFVYHDDTRYDWRTFKDGQSWNPHSYGVATRFGDDVHDGEELWQNLVSRHRNFILNLNGHVLGDGLGRLATTAHGREISQQLVNFQMRPNGGDGWLRLVEMRPDGTARAYDFSPTRGQRNESPQNQFRFGVPAVGA
ncbi:MAG: metallophosphoesterase [Planctomycetia bacterium]